MPSQGLNILPGQSTSIALKKTITERLGEPYNKCIKKLKSLDDYDSMFYKAIISKNISYSKSCCMDLCFQNEVGQNCSCYFAIYPKISNKIPYCNTSKQLECVNKKFISHYGI